MGGNMRIGDSEREAAVAQLQDHHAAGRLSTDEFNDRMGKALEAKTAAELSTLFHDLPAGLSPYDFGSVPSYDATPYYDPYALGSDYTAPPPTPATSGQGQDREPAGQPRPWYARWWLPLIAVVIIGATSGRLWVLLPLLAIWVWVIWPSLNNRKRVSQPAAPPRPLTYAERDEVILALHSTGEVAAARRYREFTGADLYTAVTTVRAMNRELGPQ